MPNMCVNEAAYKEAETTRYAAVTYAANWKYAVAAAQIALNATAAIDNYRKLNNIASDGLAIEEEQQAHMRGVYWPAETQMLNEFTQATPWDTEAVLSKRYAGRIWAPIAAQFAKEMRKLRCEKPRYCASAYSQRVQEMLTQRAATRANVTLWANRIAYYEIQAVKETDWTRRQQVIALRQGLIGQAASLIQQAQAGFAGAQGRAMGAINNAIELIGYTSTRQQGMGTDPAFNARTMRGAMDIQSGADVLNQSYGYTEEGQNFSTDPNYSPLTTSQIIGAEQNSSTALWAQTSGLDVSSFLSSAGSTQSTGPEALEGT